MAGACLDACPEPSSLESSVHSLRGPGQLLDSVYRAVSGLGQQLKGRSPRLDLQHCMVPEHQAGYLSPAKCGPKTMTKLF